MSGAETKRTQMLMAVKSRIREGQWSEWLRMGEDRDYQRTGIQGIPVRELEEACAFGRR